MTQKLLALLAVLLLGNITANAEWMSRYWDGCKPSCSWSDKPQAISGSRCKECNKQDQLITPTSDNNRSACDGGTAYTCWDMSPWVGSNGTGYGFVAANPGNGSCGQCYEITFTGQGQHGNGPTHQALSGKKMIVMQSNIGGDVAMDQLDLLVPGGGVGAFNAFSSQINVSNSDLGSQYGGLLATCPNNNGASVADNQSCLRTKCNSVFNKAGQERLKAGCNFYVDYLMAANNPKFTFTKVTCPDELKNRYTQAAGAISSGSVGSSSSAAPTTYTLTVNRNPTAGGSASASSTTGITAGTAVNITASASSGYIFQNWTGSQNFENANSANTKVTLYANTTITANFIQQSQSASSTYTLTVTRNPSGTGSTTTPASTATVTAGAPYNISASASSTYNFHDWVVVSGTASLGNANSAATTVTLNSNATIRANFTPKGTGSSSSGGGGNSSSSQQISTGNCIPPPGSVSPPNGIETCIVVAGKCYICNPDRGQQCSSEWLWTGQQVDQDYWFTPIGCPGSPSSSGSVASSSSAAVAGVNWNGAGVLKIEAEDYLSKVGSGMVTNTENGITCIGYIQNGYSATYKINFTGTAAAFPATFRIAAGLDGSQVSTFTVWINGTQVGTISKNTGSWNTYSTENLTSNISLKQGENTIELRFNTAVNVDYFELTGGPTPIIPSQTASKNGAHIQANGIQLQVASNAKLELFDLRGNSIKRINLSSGIHSVQLNDLPKGLYIAKISFGSEKKILRIPIH